MVTEATGFDFFLAHQGVVYGALARLGIHRGRSDFQDWRDEGMLVYLNYFNRYREPLVDETAIAKFNKLAWRFLFLTLMQRLQKAQHRRELENVPANTTHIQTTTLAMAPGSLQQALELKWQLQQLHRLLTPMERHVLQLRLSGLSDAAIAAQLHVSRQRILQVRKRVQAKYRALSQNCASV